MNHTSNDIIPHRTGGMTAVGVLDIILGVFVLLQGLFVILLGHGLLPATFADPESALGLAIIIALGLVALTAGVIGLVAGIGVFKLRPWGKAMSLLFAALWVADSVGAMILFAARSSAETESTDINGRVVAILLRSAYLVVLAALFAKPSWKAAFRRT